MDDNGVLCSHGLSSTFSLNVYFMYNINIFEHIQDMCLLHYNIIQWDLEEFHL